MRLSVALTPRVIVCFEDFPDHIALPRGCLGEVESLLRNYGANLTIDDKREYGAELNVEFAGQLTLIQKKAADALLAHDTGVLVAPPGIGKTVIATSIVAERRRSTLILVHRKPLLDQWVAQLSMFLQLGPKSIGRIGSGKNKPTGALDVGMFQSLISKEKVADIVSTYGHVIVDEFHHLPCVSFERVMSEIRARYVTGLTATPYRHDGHHSIIHMQLGPTRLIVHAKSHAAQRPFEHKLHVRNITFSLNGFTEQTSIQALYALLSSDTQRNDMILNDIIDALENKRSPVVLTERRDHLEYLEEQLRKCTPNLIVLHGGMKPKDRREALSRLAGIPDDVERLLLATGRFIGEGFDDARLDTLFLALPVSWKGTLVQYAGRLHRLHPGKTDVRIFDYVDREVQILRKMFEKRLRGYRAIGYRVDTQLTSRDLRHSEMLQSNQIPDELFTE